MLEDTRNTEAVNIVWLCKWHRAKLSHSHISWEGRFCHGVWCTCRNFLSVPYSVLVYVSPILTSSIHSSVVSKSETINIVGCFTPAPFWYQPNSFQIYNYMFIQTILYLAKMLVEDDILTVRCRTAINIALCICLFHFVLYMIIFHFYWRPYPF